MSYPNPSVVDANFRVPGPSVANGPATDVCVIESPSQDAPLPDLRGPKGLRSFNFSQDWSRSSSLASRAVELQLRAAKRNVSLQCIGTMPLFRNHIVSRGAGRDWVLVPLSDDPLFLHPSGFPIPRAQLRDLKRIRKTGAQFDALYVAHEVESGSVAPDGPLTLDALRPPPPRAVQKLSHHLGKTASKVWKGATLPAAMAVVGLLLAAAVTVATSFIAILAAGLVTVVAIGAFAMMAAGTVAALPALAVVDPIILGVITEPGRPLQTGENAAWFYLTHWDYGAEA